MIIIPRKSTERIWNLLISLFSIFLGIWIPLSLALSLTATPILKIGVGLTYLFLITDIYITFRWCRAKEGDNLFYEEYGLYQYFRGWFWIDLIAAIPFLAFDSISGLALISLLKLFKVGYIMYEGYQREVVIPYLYILGYFLFIICMSSHWLSCGWIALSYEGQPEDDLATTYLKALYWSITTLTTVGYGDIIPETNPQIIYTMFVQILGVGLYGYIIGNVANVLSKKDPSRAQYLENIEKLSALVSYRSMPMDLQLRIQDFYLYKWKKRLGYDESRFLQGLPQNLQEEVTLHLKKGIIDKIPLFSDASDNLIRDIAFNLEPVILIPGDYICKEGEIGETMYFIIRGSLGVFKEDSGRIGTIDEGDFFGEIALFLNQPRSASIQAETYCDIYRLDKQPFERVMAKYPKFASKIEKKAKFRRSKDI
ncbi:MAG: cyclic nucleotide-binding domain-containing protein [Bacteroidota bacterium]